MKEQEHMHDPLNEAPLLRSLKGKADPFVAPIGFFDRFPHTVQERIIKKDVSADAIWFKRLALSCGVIAVVIAVWWALPVGDPSAADPISEELVIDVSQEELPMDESLLREAHSDPDQPLFENVMIELEEDELMAYLENENVDVELLIEEL